MDEYNFEEGAIRSFYDGVREGVTMYAHWKDGVQYVGTTGRTLALALEKIKLEEGAALRANAVK